MQGKTVLERLLVGTAGFLGSPARVAGSILLAVAVLCSVGCRPPAILAVEPEILQLGDFPRGTRLVELQLEDRSRLRGVHVPADEGAPLVLCFQAGGRSIAPFRDRDIRLGMEPLAHHLRGLGLSMLVFDYRGVGVSTGDRDPDNLLDDSRAMWREASRLVEGDSERIVLRGTSLGTLAVASLLDDGVRPGAAVLISPIRAETVVVNAGSLVVGRLLAVMGDLFLKPIVDVEIVESLGRAEGPLLVIASSSDAFLPEDEQELLKGAIRDHGRWVESTRGLGVESDPFFGHVVAAGINERIPDRLESRLYEDLFATSGRAARRTSTFVEKTPESLRGALGAGEWRRRLAAVAKRFHPNSASLAVAIALEGGDVPVEEYAAWLYNLPSDVIERLPFEAALELVDLADPSRDLRIGLLVDLSLLFSTYKKPLTLEEIIDTYCSCTSGCLKLPRLTDSPADEIVNTVLARTRAELEKDDSLTDLDRNRLLLRTLAKANGIPDRLIGESRSTVALWERGRWVEVLLNVPPDDVVIRWLSASE